MVEFWSRDGQLLGTKETLEDPIVEITGVPALALRGAPLSGFTPNERLRWAAKRDTKRKEDKAYCMLGLFEVFLSPIYGEGENAFVRLQYEIDKIRGSLPKATYGASNREDTATSSLAEDSDRQSRRQDLLASLSFDQIDARHSTIKDAQRTTCGWLLTHPAYVAWNDQQVRPGHQGVLWVAGKPGAGKSTLMKFAFAHASKSKSNDEVVLSFFFNARGDDLEKTTLGMYQSLLFQFLKAVPDAQIVLDAIPEAPSWTLKVLQDVMSNAVQHLGQRNLRCFIDALDECNEQQVRDMVEFFRDLAEYDLHDEGRISICFASRHYPTIDCGNGTRLVLEDEAGHGEDLAKYIRRHLKIGQRASAHDICTRLQEKANSVFMWVVLVVDVLNVEYARGSISNVKRRLEEIPSGLSDLFKDLLRRDRVRMDELLLCLQWILFAKRPLRREEFYFAMEAGLHPDVDRGTEWVPEPWDPDETTVEDMRRFVLSSSKGLAELTRSKKAPTVQFIHESVRDFLLKDGGLH